ncbi:MAG: cytochrome c peroxidase, partial [Chitinophagales bacterium]
LIAGVFLQMNQNPYPRTIELPYNSEKFTPPKIPADNPQSIEGIALGRLLFYDKLLSNNNQQSCGSCHIQKLAFTDGQKRAIGSKGDTVLRNTMSLINLAWGNQFFWDGRVKSLEGLVHHPITDTLEMNRDTSQLISDLKEHSYYPELFQRAFPEQAINMETLSKALAQFVRTITAEAQDLPDSIKIAYQLNDINLSPTQNNLPYEIFSLEPEGLSLSKADTQTYAAFKKQSFSTDMQTEASFQGMYFRLGIMCTPCHTGESFGGALMANNLLDKNQNTLFKVPSLINILHTAPYMRDGRFDSPDEILEHYDAHISELHLVNTHLNIPPIPNLITEYDKKHFKKFLEIFNDSTVIQRDALSNPFEAEDFSWKKYMSKEK